jgi:pimeloyl-ACP methyl ester carboxylesterase
MPQANIPANIGSVTLEYETIGSASNPAVLLIQGFGAQLINWPDQFCQMLVDQGFFVIRFDNRDCGLSTKLDGVVVDPNAVFAAALSSEEIPPVPYTLSDLAQDAIELLNHLKIDSAHILGASMGGMIAQTLVIEHPERARSLISLYSVTGEFEIGAPTAEAAEALLGPPPTERQAYIDASPKYGVWQSKRYFDEVAVKRQVASWRLFMRAAHELRDCKNCRPLRWSFTEKMTLCCHPKAENALPNWCPVRRSCLWPIWAMIFPNPCCRSSRVRWRHI